MDTPPAPELKARVGREGANYWLYPAQLKAEKETKKLRENDNINQSTLNKVMLNSKNIYSF